MQKIDENRMQREFSIPFAQGGIWGVKNKTKHMA